MFKNSCFLLTFMNEGLDILIKVTGIGFISEGKSGDWSVYSYPSNVLVPLSLPHCIPLDSTGLCCEEWLHVHYHAR